MMKELSQQLLFSSQKEMTRDSGRWIDGVAEADGIEMDIQISLTLTRVQKLWQRILILSWIKIDGNVIAVVVAVPILLPASLE